MRSSRIWRGFPNDSLLSQLINSARAAAAQEHRRRSTEMRCSPNCVFLLIAGHETTGEHAWAAGCARC